MPPRRPLAFVLAPLAGCGGNRDVRVDTDRFSPRPSAGPMTITHGD